MAYSATTATHKVIQLHKRVRLLAGGTSASKTISVLLYLIQRCQTDTKPTLTSVVSETFPHLKRGAIRDFLNIMQEHGYFEDGRWNKSDSIYRFETGSELEFFSADMPSKVRGPRRNRLFVNEVNNVPKEAWDQLLLRTKEFAFADWNPVSDFYLYEDYGLQDEHGASTTDPDTEFLILTYKDNEGLDPSIVGEIEKRRGNRHWWRVYGEGKRGEVEGKIYKGWKLDLDEVPHEARLERRGLDFGYSNDPAGLLDIYYLNGGYILDERLYQLGMSNKRIADLVLNLDEPHTLVVGDSAEPKSIDELRLWGVNVIAANKGPGSVHQGISYVQDQRISVTKRSVNLIKEYRNYMWQFDKDGKQLDVPEEGFDHLMDALRYGMESLRASDKRPSVHVPARVKQAMARQR